MNHQINIDEAIAIAYVQNRIIAIEMQHTVENDPITEDTSFLTKELAQV